MLTKTQKTGRTGFTLVELLTVMAIIALLIGLMVPAMGHVKTTAKIVQQKAQLKSIENALESFSAAYGEYPPSNETSKDTDYTASGDITCGAQKLAEALVGVDMRGFDPKAPSFLSGGVTKTASFDRAAIAVDKYSYAVDGVNTAVPADVTDSLNRRKGPYITVNENVNSFELADIYNGVTGSKLYMGGAPGRDSTGAVAKKFGNVICDNFKVKSITYNAYDFSTNANVSLTAKVGTPILYYRADSSKKQLSASTTPTSSDASIDDSIYNWHDNMNLVSLGRMTNYGLPHYWMDTTNNPANYNAPAGDKAAWAFYSYIQNTKINTGRWPYNPDSFLLISAGPDSIYGTADDITNFGSMDMK
jgi:prepilin-type N-terminal cleavage/methylation domain-containing protein